MDIGNVVLDKNVEKSEASIDLGKISTTKKLINMHKSRINQLFLDMEISESSIINNFDGDGGRMFAKAYKKIADSNENVLYNVDLHIDELNRACALYQTQDSDLGDKINTDISNGIFY